MFSSRFLPGATVATSLLLTSTCALTGCGSALIPTVAASKTTVTGNWQLSSTIADAAKLPMLSGELTGGGSAITGIFHSSAASTCISPKTAIELTGSADARNQVTLKGAQLAGGILTVSGILAPDGKSLSNATYNVSGGTCAFAHAVPVNAQAYSSITGNYSGTFSDPDGQVLSITAALTQTPSSDTDGNFTLSGSGNLGANPCFNSPVSVTDSQVTGGSFSLTYADSTTGNSVQANGTFSPDGTTLTVTQWTLAGSCGPDTGTGLLTRQPQ